MRIYLTTTRNTAPVPYNHLAVLTGILHRWLGKDNAVHGEVALYSFSWLQGARKTSEGLTFPNGARWFISAHQPELISSLVEAIRISPEMNYGLQVRSITIHEDPVFLGPQRFTVASPVLVKLRDGERTRHITYRDSEADMLLTRTLATKLSRAGIDPQGSAVAFDREYRLAKTKKVNYREIGNMASVCPVVVEGTPEQIAFTWNVGVGNSTGIGFGALI